MNSPQAAGNVRSPQRNETCRWDPVPTADPGAATGAILNPVSFRKMDKSPCGNFLVKYFLFPTSFNL